MAFQFPVYFRQQVDSTMDLAKEVIANQQPAGPFIAAAHVQNRGRGRLGRSWATASPSVENIPFEEFTERWTTLDAMADRASNILPFTLAIPRRSLKIPLSWVSIASGCALYDATDDLSIFLCSAYPQLGFSPLDSPRRIFLKWPNDLISCQFPDAQKESNQESIGQSFKLAGILAETSSQSGEWSWVLLGFGINLTAAPQWGVQQVDAKNPASQVPGALLNALVCEPEQPMPKWFSRWTANKSNLSVVCGRFLESFQREIFEYLFYPRTIGQLRSLALARMIPSGTLLNVLDCIENSTSAPTVVSAQFTGLGDDGSLLLAGQPPIYAGDVSIRIAPTKQDATAPRKPLQVAMAVSHHRSKFEKTKKSVVGLSGVPNSVTGSLRMDSEEGKMPGLLLLDLGNTRLHWGFSETLKGEMLFGHYPLLETNAESINFLESFRDLLVKLSPVKRRSLIFAAFSVREVSASRAFVEQLEAAICKAYPEIRVQRTLVDLPWLVSREQQLAGLVQEYGSSLGIDRALRMAFLYWRAQEARGRLAALSLGTATTLEVMGLDANESGKPKLLDSMIMPGLQASFNALHDSTKRLPKEDFLRLDRHVLDPSATLSTQVSMARGVIRGSALACAAVCRENNVDKLWIGGGAAAHFLALVGSEVFSGIEVQLEEHLSLRALQSLLGAKLESESFRPVTSIDVSQNQEKKPPETHLGQESQNIAQSLFKGRRHYRSLAASGELREPPDLGLLEEFGSVEIDPDSRDYRRLGPRIETSHIGERLDRHLAIRYRFHSREEWQERIARGDVLLESNASRIREMGLITKLWKVKHTYRMKPCDQLWLFQPSEYEPGFVSTVSILKEFGDAVAFHKPGNLVVHATGLYGKNTFLDVLAGMGMKDAYPVHRIDRETSGILLCARKSETRRRLAELFRDGCADKMYLAFAREYVPVPDQFWIDASIGPASQSLIRLKMWIDSVADAAHARTYFRKLAQVGDCCLFACFPETGRTNQIRVHLAAAGQWILGDKMYHPDEAVFLEYFEHGLTPKLLNLIEIPRQALHNAVLGASVIFEEIFRDGPIVCPVSPDLMELRVVRDLLEASGLGLSESAQISGIQRLILTREELRQIRDVPVLSNSELRARTQTAQDMVSERVRESLR